MPEDSINGVFKLDTFTKFEKTRIIGARALQISVGAPLLISIKEKSAEPLPLAMQEFTAGVIPISVRRRLPKKLEKKSKK
ncbi:MAG: DNA-directed RNA polymerase subunit K [Candidatus Aenigmarchaeota archaeon]|nr:DNA-directed RNA polymerase subunit K [Candidatus Aenigmarchaeota archaeon]